jgi:hypothetical protein
MWRTMSGVRLTLGACRYLTIAYILESVVAPDARPSWMTHREDAELGNSGCKLKLVSGSGSQSRKGKPGLPRIPML